MNTSPAPGSSQTPTKAVLAAILATVTALVATLSDRTEIDSMRAVDWVIVVGSAVVTGFATWYIPNSPK